MVIAGAAVLNGSSTRLSTPLWELQRLDWERFGFGSPRRLVGADPKSFEGEEIVLSIVQSSVAALPAYFPLEQRVSKQVNHFLLIP